MEPHEPSTLPTTRHPLTRSRSDRMIAGVCGGAGRHLDIDPALLRIALVLLTVFGAGVGAVLYVAAWILVPEDGRG
ncbi:PspC domain-containing protein [Pseudonocardia sp.]|uniref:PspC domain-containing protein n=1 Tax=Pseudonocardia sp. TaxID=60912 RepID=UPI00261C22E9|nr:PspC domain-containing protein [Pseudonocardia sp.]